MKILHHPRRNISFTLLASLACLSSGSAAPAPSKPGKVVRSAAWQARTKIAQQQGMGESAPDWLMDSESYAIGYDNNDWGGLAQSKVSFITHCPVNRDFFAKAHGLGIRCFPYVTFYHANAHGQPNMFFTSPDLRQHADWIEVDDKGNRKRSAFWETEDMKNEYLVCPDVQGYQDAMVAYVKNLMEMGADGVFVDVLTTREQCFGAKFGAHKHIYNDANHAFAQLLKRVRDTIHQYQPEGALLGNSGNPIALPKEYIKYIDADMAESYILTWVSTDRRFDWKDYWQKKNHDLQPYIRAGKAIQALSFLGHTPYGVREDGFFAYASARLAGFTWNGGLALGRPEIAELFRLKLGKPLTGEKEENGLYYRAFENGLVALNPDKENAHSLTVAAPIPATRFVDLFGGGAASWPVYSGRGYRLDSTTKHSDSASMMMENKNLTDNSATSQGFTLNQATPQPITISGWSKAENVSGEPSGDYSLYVDAAYNDGTYLYGQIAAFDTGTHEWQQKSFTFTPAKPIKNLTFSILLRSKTGKAWFDDISMRQGDGPNLIANGGFEARSTQGGFFDTVATDGKIQVPAFSGRVYLYASDNRDQGAKTGPTLTIKTEPGLGEVRFKIDGFDMWTHTGRWTTEYILGPEFGAFSIQFDKPGQHTIELVDVVPGTMKTPAGYGAGEKLGDSMNPSNPTKPSRGEKFRFRAWNTGAPAPTNNPKITVDVNKDTTLTALFDVEGPTQP